MAGVRGAPRRAQRGRHGRRAHLRLPDRRAGSHERGRHDRRLGAVALRRARAAVEPDHQRGPRRQPGGVRHHVQATRHHRVGVSPAPSAFESTPDDLLEGLNPVQREAVTHGDGPLLIVAGAGSGKTRVLTHRIAWLIADRGISPFEILAITFTNKAADEMKHRVGALVGPVAQKMWVSTFHSACVRILRRDAGRLGYRSSFTIYDQADAVRLTSYVIRDLNIDAKRFPPRS